MHRPTAVTDGFVSADLGCVDPAEVAYAWPIASRWIRDAIRRGDLGTFEATQADVLAGRALLWIAFDGVKPFAAVVTQIAMVESGKCCTIVACGGNGVLRALPLLSKIEDYARRESCRVIRLLGRKGWMRALQEYQQTRVVLEKEL